MSLSYFHGKNQQDVRNRETHLPSPWLICRQESSIRSVVVDRSLFWRYAPKTKSFCLHMLFFSLGNISKPTLLPVRSSWQTEWGKKLASSGRGRFSGLSITGEHLKKLENKTFFLESESPFCWVWITLKYAQWKKLVNS